MLAHKCLISIVLERESPQHRFIIGQQISIMRFLPCQDFMNMDSVTAYYSSTDSWAILDNQLSMSIGFLEVPLEGVSSWLWFGEVTDFYSEPGFDLQHFVQLLIRGPGLPYVFHETLHFLIKSYLASSFSSSLEKLEI